MRDSFVLYTKYKKQIDILNDEQVAVLFRAILSYQCEEELPTMDGMTELVFSMIKEQFDIDYKKWLNTCERNAKNIRKRWNKEDTTDTSGMNGNTKNTSGKSGIQQDTKYTDNDSDCDNESEYESDDDIDKSMKLFFKTYQQVQVDILSHTSLISIDFSLLLKEFEQSDYLRNECNSLNWLIRNYKQVIAGKYRNKPKPNSDYVAGSSGYTLYACDIGEVKL